MVTCLTGLGKDAEYHLIESAYGHDAFLLEHETFAPMVRSFLGRVTAGGI
jgi:homoserine O-acetyltransferase